MITFRNQHETREIVVRSRVVGVPELQRRDIRLCPERVSVTFSRHNEEPWGISVVVYGPENEDATPPEWVVWHDEELPDAPGWVCRYVAHHMPVGSMNLGRDYSFLNHSAQRSWQMVSFQDGEAVS